MADDAVAAVDEIPDWVRPEAVAWVREHGMHSVAAKLIGALEQTRDETPDGETVDGVAWARQRLAQAQRHLGRRAVVAHVRKQVRLHSRRMGRVSRRRVGGRRLRRAGRTVASRDGPERPRPRALARRSAA